MWELLIIVYFGFGTFCDTDCPIIWKGDSICDSSCMTPKCEFDRGDCNQDCINKGCKKMQPDGICDEMCNYFECGYDFGDCSECEKLGCYKHAPDGNCEPKCNNQVCQYDFGDCSACQKHECYKKSADGICDLECNNSDCGNDYGDCTFCNNNCKSLVSNDICDVACNTIQCQNDFGDCTVCGNGCTKNLLSNSVCDSECNTEDCTYDNNVCNCSGECKKPMLSNGVCDVKCFVPECNYDIGDKNACLKTYYVTSNQVMTYDGTLEKPFPNILLALGMPIDFFAEILLVGDGSFSLSSGEEYSSQCFKNLKTFHATIRPLLCSEKNVPGCYNEGSKAVIMISKAAVCMEISQYLTIENIIFSQNDKVDPLCATSNYCRSTVKINDTIIYDDQGNLLNSNTYLNQSYCDKFNRISLFDLKSSSALLLNVIIMQNVNFENMRFGYKNLIKSASQNVTFLNVDFYNIYTKDETLFIEGDYTSIFNYQGGSVEFLNNGFEPIGTAELNSFIKLRAIESIIMSDIEFINNLVNGKNRDLISIDTVFKLNITGILFKDNYADYGLINILQDYSTEYEDALILISGCTFERNFMSYVINIFYKFGCQNINIENNDFTENIASNDIVYLKYTNDYATRCSLSKWSTNFENNNFTSNYAKYKIIEISKLGNVTLTNNIIEKNGEFINPNLTIKLDIIKVTDAYLKLGLPFIENSLCKELVYLDEITGLEISNMHIQYNLCPLIKIFKNTNFLTFEKNYFLHNFQSSDEWFVYLVSDFCSIKNLTFINNTYSGVLKGLLYIEGTSDNQQCSLDNFYIEKSIDFINFQHIQQLEISSMTVTDKIDCNPSTILFTISSDSTFILTDSTFEKGKSRLLSFSAENNGKSLLLNIESVTISQYSTELLIYIDPSLQIDKNSFIDSLSVIDSSSKLLSISSTQGKLLLENCIFTNNNIPSDNLIEVSGNNELAIKNSTFEKNSANIIIYIFSSKNNTFLSIQNTNFTQNYGSVVKILYATAEFINTYFYNNTAEYGTVAYLTSESKAVFNNCKLEKNTASKNGVISVMSTSAIEVLYTNFIENTANGKGGVLFIDQSSIIDAKSSQFIKNKAFQGSCIFAQHSQDESKIDNCTFSQNSAGYTGCLSTLESNFTLSNSLFTSNIADNYPAIEILYYSTITLLSCTFSNHSGVGAHIGIENESILNIKNSKFLSSSSSLCCSVFKVINSYFTCDFCTVSDSKSYRSSAIYCEKSYGLYRNCAFLNSVFDNIYTEDYGAVIQGESLSEMIFSNVTIRNFDGSAIYLTRQTSGDVENSYFECEDYLDGSGIQGTGIQCLECSEIIIKNSGFKNLSSTYYGGCLYLNTYDNEKIISIKDSTFDFCISYIGGGIYLIDSNISISKCEFTENQAESGNLQYEGQGGALFFEYPNKQCTAEIKDSLFVKNKATVSGGAIQWYDYQPIIADCSFSSNIAEYGPNTASFPCKLEVSESRQLNEIEFAPGQTIPIPIIAYIQDHYNQTVATDFSTTAEIFEADSINYTVTGYTKVTADYGVLNFSNIIIIGTPNTSTSLIIASSLPILSGSNQDISIDIKMRYCIIGEALEGGNTCKKCNKETYNINAGELCKKCPSGAVCQGEANIVAAPGYWRYGKYTDYFFECFYAEACLGELSSSVCLEGYTSNLCQSCSVGYSRSGDNQCAKCLDRDQSALILTGWMVFNVLTIVVLTASSINDAFKEESITSIYFKIFMNYLQLVTLTISFELNWPWLVKQMFYYQNRASGSLNQNYSFDCFLYNNIEPFYAKLIFLNVAPLICFLASGVFWPIWGRIRKSTNLKQKLFGSMVVQLFMLHPNLLKYNFSIFNCMEISPGQNYLVSDLSLKCWGSRHILYSIGVAIPGIIIWCIFIPAFLLLILYRRRNQLSSEAEKIKYGFLYKGFKSNRYYWEFVIMLRKIIIICSSVFLKNTSPGIQALIVFVVILFAYTFQRRLEPYSVGQLNEMELRSIMVSVVTIYAGLFFLTNHIDSYGKTTLFVFMVIMNTIFLLYWGYYTFGFYIRKIYLKCKAIKNIFSVKIQNWKTKMRADRGLIYATNITASYVDEQKIHSIKVSEVDENSFEKKRSLSL
ncbi:hypothetical protein SteCoe_8680 [Stentor coeruleus]|uniref:LNR domain-containing protein n=1 Tax=Stentor coeruleus TaxID=5963 RepID=A0A1R2CJM8_9CILI|nr:hypothetical protein SteCoe_8680 [Stentor coeruleus]